VKDGCVEKRDGAGRGGADYGKKPRCGERLGRIRSSVARAACAGWPEKGVECRPIEAVFLLAELALHLYEALLRQHIARLRFAHRLQRGSGPLL
jgi:hypothetical protein